MFYGPKIIKMALDQQWYPKSAWRHGHFSKNLFFILRGFFFFFFFFCLLLLYFQTFYFSRWIILLPELGEESGVQLSSEGHACFCQASRRNQGDSLRCHYSASGQREAGKLREASQSGDQPWSKGHWASSCRPKGSAKREIPAWGGSVDLTLTLLQEVGLASVGNGLIFRLCPLDLLFPQLLWTYLLSHSVWYKRVMKRKPGRWEDCGTGVLAWACPECQIQGKIFTFSSPDTSSAKWM